MVATTAASDTGTWRAKAVTEQNEHDYDRGQHHRRRAGVGQAVEDLPQPKQRIAGARGYAEHVAEHGDADLASDPARNPLSTVRERKSARNPSLKARANNNSPAVSSAVIPTRAV